MDLEFEDFLFSQEKIREICEIFSKYPLVFKVVDDFSEDIKSGINGFSKGVGKTQE
jgi:hypothetical protein